MTRQSNSNSQENQQISLFAKATKSISSLWNRSQIGHSSEYSVERLLAFRDYYQRTSITRAITICTLSPLPAVLTTLAIDCIPLRPPSDGWKENYAVWIRLLLAIFIEAFAVTFQVRAVIVPGTITIFQGVKIALGTAICSVLATMAVAASWKFPIPYGYIIMLNLYVIFFVIYMILAIGPKVLVQSPILQQQIKSELLVMMSQSCVAVAYPVSSAVFNRLSGAHQALLIFMMPLIKFITKQNIVKSAGSFYEYVGPVLVFSVDLFNIFYLAICMQTAKSMTTTLIIIGIDSFHVILALRAIFQRTNSVQATPEIVIGEPKHYLLDLPAGIRKVFNGVVPSHQNYRRIRLLAPFPLSLSEESKTFMRELVRTGSFANDTARCSIRSISKSSKQVGPPLPSAYIPSIAIVSTTKQKKVSPVSPFMTTPAQILRPASLPRDISMKAIERDSSFDDNEDVIRDALQTLFHSEYVLMAEYIEFIIPVLYALYLSVLVHLDVAVYYPHTASMTTNKLKDTVTNILIYGALEFIAFGALLILLKRKFGYSPLYQLAFVLECQAPAIQGHLFLWTISILQITLVHYGTYPEYLITCAMSLVLMIYPVFHVGADFIVQTS